MSQWCLAPQLTSLSRVFSVQRNPLVADYWMPTSGGDIFDNDDDWSGWNVEHVQDFSFLWEGVRLLAGRGLEHWSTGQAVNLEGMFRDCCHDTPWRGNLSGWDTARVVHMKDMFRGSAVRFGSDNDIRGWNVSSLQTAEGMLADVVGFDQDLCTAWNGSWPSADVTVTNMLSGTACPEPQDPVPGVSFCHACAETASSSSATVEDDGDDNAATVQPQQEDDGGNVAPPAPQQQQDGGDTHNVNNGGDDGPLILSSRNAEDSGAGTIRASPVLRWTVSTVCVLLLGWFV